MPQTLVLQLHGNNIAVGASKCIPFLGHKNQGVQSFCRKDGQALQPVYAGFQWFTVLSMYET